MKTFCFPSLSHLAYNTYWTQYLGLPKLFQILSRLAVMIFGKGTWLVYPPTHLLIRSEVSYLMQELKHAFLTVKLYPRAAF